ncbi:SPFH domain-containing protein [Streptomyces sp. 135]|uniref:SPFH domain-containing protein n=1 Tax=Streptomyces sp. 135 TaxID=2838850 RepID=UPI001CBD9826|nr:SPFH domain-containing protein [Streptomyces sp. 135]
MKEAPERQQEPVRSPGVRMDHGPAGALAVRSRDTSIRMDALFKGDVVKTPSPKPGDDVPATGGQSRQPGMTAPLPDPRLTERRAKACSGWWGVLIALLAVCGAGWVAWAGGVLPSWAFDTFRLADSPRYVTATWRWPALVGCAVVALVALGGLGRGRHGTAWNLSLFGRYRGTVRRTGLLWVYPAVLRRRVDVRLRHWRSEPMPAADAQGMPLRVVVLVIWQVRDAARAMFSVDDHAAYLREQVAAVTARVVSGWPADQFAPAESGPTLRDAGAVSEVLTRGLAAQCRAVGIEVFSAQLTWLEYAPEVAAVMQRRRIAALDAEHRDHVLTTVLDAVDDTVHRITERGLVELDDYERKALVKDLTVAFYTARGSATDTQ